VPTYQYACTECGHQLEAVQSFSDPALTECPNCHGKLRKVFNSVGIVFKGSGFYRNDSRSGNVSAEKSSGAESTPAKKSESTSSSTSSDSSSSSSTSSSSSSTTTTTKAAAAS
jgi:putative FmdB family regulatory protein